MRAFVPQDFDDRPAHRLGSEDDGGGAEREDLLDHLLLVEVVVEDLQRVDFALLVE